MQVRFDLLRETVSPDLRSPGDPGSWDYETWADDLDRVLVSLGRQDFPAAARLLTRWLARTEPAGLAGRGLYLRGRSLILFADMRRDQGLLRGPDGAAPAYQAARRIFSGLDIPRRVAQAELSLTVVTEMCGCLDAAAGAYRRLAADERLGSRDRARAELWIGTALSKARQHEAAVRVMLPAIQAFDALDTRVREAGPAATPMQRVRLDTACAHILLSDRATTGNGLAMLDAAARLSSQFGLAHQAASIEGIRCQYASAQP